MEHKKLVMDREDRGLLSPCLWREGSALPSYTLTPRLDPATLSPDLADFSCVNTFTPPGNTVRETLLLHTLH